MQCMGNRTPTERRLNADQTPTERAAQRSAAQQKAPLCFVLVVLYIVVSNKHYFNYICVICPLPVILTGYGPTITIYTHKSSVTYRFEAPKRRIAIGPA